HGSEEGAFADAAAAEDADTLSLAAGEERVDGANAGAERLGDVDAIDRVGGCAVEPARVVSLDGRPVVHGFPDTTDAPPEESGAKELVMGGPGGIQRLAVRYGRGSDWARRRGGEMAMRPQEGVGRLKASCRDLGRAALACVGREAYTTEAVGEAALDFLELGI